MLTSSYVVIFPIALDSRPLLIPFEHQRRRRAKPSSCAPLGQITERDEAPLKYLVDITSDKELGDAEQKGFRLHFHFLPNPYFENT